MNYLKYTLSLKQAIIFFLKIISKDRDFNVHFKFLHSIISTILETHTYFQKEKNNKQNKKCYF